MNHHTLSGFEYSDKAAKRAQSEEMEFDVPTAGVVVVTNVSHDSAHSVNVEDGVPVGCSCKADQYQPGACKHRVACAINEPVLEAASRSGNGKRALADGGHEPERVTVEVGTRGARAVATADGVEILPPETRDESEETHHAPGCDNPRCEGIDADADRPLLSMDCWHEWAAYDEEEARR